MNLGDQPRAGPAAWDLHDAARHDPRRNHRVCEAAFGPDRRAPDLRQVVAEARRREAGGSPRTVIAGERTDHEQSNSDPADAAVGVRQRHGPRSGTSRWVPDELTIEPTSAWLGSVDGLPSAERSAARPVYSTLQQALPGGVLPIDVWIDGHRLVRRITTSMDLSLPTGADVQESTTVDFSDFAGRGHRRPRRRPTRCSTRPACSAPPADRSAAGRQLHAEDRASVASSHFQTAAAALK